MRSRIVSFETFLIIGACLVFLYSLLDISCAKSVTSLSPIFASKISGTVSESYLLKRSPKRLAIVVPFERGFDEQAKEFIAKWKKYEPCDKTGLSPSYTSLVLYSSVKDSSRSSAILKQWLSDPVLAKWSCFSDIKLVTAQLNSRESLLDSASEQFYHLLLNHTEFHKQYDVVFWMGMDVAPIKDNWLDALYKEAIIDDFWVKGSLYRGRKLPLNRPKEGWKNPINRNALYVVGVQSFNEILTNSRQWCSRIEPVRPFDECLFAFLQAFPDNFHVYQTVASHYLFSDFIYHYGYHPDEEDLSSAVTNPDCYLIHTHI